MNNLSRNLKRKAFVKKYREKIKKLIDNERKTGVLADKLQEGRKLIELARKKLDFSPWTASHDILAGLLRSFRRLHRK